MLGNPKKTSFCSIIDPYFAKNILKVKLNRVYRHVKANSNILVSFASCY